MSSPQMRVAYKIRAKLELSLLYPREPHTWGGHGICVHTHARTIRNRERKARANMVQSFESLLHTQKPFRRLWNVKCCLQRHPMQAMNVRELEKSLESAGLVKRSPNLANLLQKFPAIFRVSHTVGMLYPVVEFSDEGKELLQEEKMIQTWYEPHLVQKIRKLLMMSLNKMLKLDQICLLQRELALPHDFNERIVSGYPQFFTVVELEDGHYLKLTAWDDSLAITAREQDLKENPLFDKCRRPLPFGFPISLPKGHRLGLKNRELVNAWQKTAFPSPYEDATCLNPMSVEAGKHSVATLHEILNLTVEKRTTVEHLEMLRLDLKMPRKLPAFLDRHFGIFYLSHSGDRNHVFLKDAYRNVNKQKIIAYLKEKGPHVLLNEMFCKLMEVRRL